MELGGRRRRLLITNNYQSRYLSLWYLSSDKLLDMIYADMIYVYALYHNLLVVAVA